MPTQLGVVLKINSSIEGISPDRINLYPFPHLVINNFFSESDWDDIKGELIRLETAIPDNKFESEFGVKSEWKNFDLNFEKVSGLIEHVFSEDFISRLKMAFGIDPETILFPDRTFDGGGYVISPPGSFLGYHADFNFSSKTNAYRILNVLIYANQDYSDRDGGILHLLDPVSKTVEKSVPPNENTLLAFLTDDLAFHGVSRNSEKFFRRSFNLYYYSNLPVSRNQSESPHRTIWLDVETHNH